MLLYSPGVLEPTNDALTRTHLCGYDFNLTYPQKSKFPPVGPTTPPTEGGEARVATLASRSPKLIRKNLVAIAKGMPNPASGLVRRETAPEAREVIAREHARRTWLEEKRIIKKRDLTGRANGTIDPFYGCFLSEEIEDYALNFSLPWSTYTNLVAVNDLPTSLLYMAGLSQERVISSLDDFGPFNVRGLGLWHIQWETNFRMIAVRYTRCPLTPTRLRSYHLLEWYV